MELTTRQLGALAGSLLFMMSKIQNLNGTHNRVFFYRLGYLVVYDVKDTKFEWNSQLHHWSVVFISVVYDVKDTKFEWNSQLIGEKIIPMSCCL